MLFPPLDVDVVAGSTPTWKFSSTTHIPVRPFDVRNDSSEVAVVLRSKQDPDEFWRRMTPFVGPSQSSPTHYGFPLQASKVSLLKHAHGAPAGEEDMSEKADVPDRSSNIHLVADSPFRIGFLDVLKWKLLGTDEHPRAPSIPTAIEAAFKLPVVPSIDVHNVYKYDPCGVSRFGVPKDAPRQLGTFVDDGERFLSATWLSHSAYLVNCDGISILTDPVFSARASPFQFAGPLRMQPAIVPNCELPYVDVVTISHNHYDHLDTAVVEYLIKYNHWHSPAHSKDVGAIKQAALKTGGGALPRHPVFVVPMGMKQRWFKSICPESLDLDLVVELYWWDTASVGAAVAENRRRWRAFHKVEPPTAFGADNGVVDVKVTGTPAQHWSMRIPGDRNKELFCGFAMEVDGSARGSRDGSRLGGPGKNVMTRPWRLYHGGDTGFAPLPFEQTGCLFLEGEEHKEEYHTTNHNTKGDGHLRLLYDFSMIAIGAYSPRNLMFTQHINPAEAVMIHQALRSRCSAGMHWGTFILTDEPVNEPPSVLKREMEAAFGPGAGSLTPQERFEVLLFTDVADGSKHPLAVTENSPTGHKLFAGAGLHQGIDAVKSAMFQYEVKELGCSKSRKEWEEGKIRSIANRPSTIPVEDTLMDARLNGRTFRAMMHGETWVIPSPT